MVTGSSGRAIVAFGLLAVLAIASSAVALGFGDGIRVASGTWRRIPPVPLELGGGVGVWSGDELLVWSGKTSALAGYSPHGNTWRTLPVAVLANRQDSSAVWTGTEMIVWGGMRWDTNAGPTMGLDDGAAFNPASHAWRPIARSPLSGRWDHQALWTGREMVIWGGTDDHTSEGLLRDGAAYDPVTDAWRLISPAPHDDAWSPQAFWTGREMVVCCGATDANGKTTGPMPAPVAYDPSTDRWRSLAEPPDLPALQWMGHWTGADLLMVGRKPLDWQGPRFSGGALFDVSRNRWRTIAAPPERFLLDDPQREDRFAFAFHVWTGTGLLIWGGRNREAAVYNADRNRWSLLPMAPAENLEAWYDAVWTGEEMLIWGGHPLSDRRGLWSYNPGLAFAPTTATPASEREHEFESPHRYRRSS